MFSFFDGPFGTPPLLPGLRCLVFAHVDFIQIRTVEGHAAVRAHVRLLTGVSLLVGYQTRFRRQTHGAVRTMES